MKQNIFNTYVSEVCKIFNVKKKMLFTKTKKRDVVDARQLLYWLCRRRPMNIVYIKEYMLENGYDISHSVIHYGIAVVEQKVSNDADYVETIKSILDEANV